MARGFVSGVLWGGVLAFGTVGVASIIAPQPSPPVVSDAAPVAVSPERVVDAGSGETGSNRDNLVVTNQVAPQTQAPESDSIAALDGAVMTAPLQPVAGTSEAVLTFPATSALESNIVVAGDTPVLPNPQALAPLEPQTAENLSISTEPAQLPAPQVVEDAGEVDPQSVTEEVASAEAIAPQDDTAGDTVGENAEVTEVQTPEPVIDTTEIATAPEAPSTTEPTKTEVAALVPDPEVQPEPTPEIGAVTAPETPDTEPLPEGDNVQADTGETVSVARPSIGQPVGTIGDRDTGVTIRRPSSANLGETDDGQDETEVATLEGIVTADDDTRPIKRFSQEYADPEGKPLMAIVLIDDGASPVAGASGIAALRSFPYPLSFAVNAAMPDAEERMTIYRNEGFEVLAMIDLPDGAQASDAETAFGSILPQMPDVVGVLEGAQSGFQGAKDVSDQVTSILLQTGHGLLTQDKGLNTMPKLARKAGVPADPVFRDFDGKGQSTSVIRRFLDQAAFKAGQEGAVVMLGRLRPDTISALLIWGLQDRAGKVALVPISAVLLREE